MKVAKSYKTGCKKLQNRFCFVTFGHDFDTGYAGYKYFRLFLIL
jgi:hypothetical protein